MTITHAAITLAPKIVTPRWARIAFGRVPSTVTTVVLGAHDCEVLSDVAAGSIARELSKLGARAVLVGASEAVANRLDYAATKNRVTITARDIDSDTLLRS